jgi:N-sulfoglucosamine sulfohydrolase
VLLVMRGHGGFHGGKVSDAMVSQLDLFPTICDLVGIEPPDWLSGTSLLPLVRRETEEVNDATFAELTYHAAYDPQRAVRTPRFKYLRRFDDRHPGPVLPNVDDSPSKDLLLAHGWAGRPRPREQLYDLVFDPGEAANVVDDPLYEDVAGQLRERLERWMHETRDPLLAGPIAPAPGVRVNDPWQRSPSDPTHIAAAADVGEGPGRP